MGIKTEPQQRLTSTDSQQPSSSTESSSNNWKKEKDSLIYQIGNLKAELQSAVASSTIEKEKMNKEISSKNSILKEKEELQIKFDKIKEEAANLMRENKMITGQLKQLQHGIVNQSVERDEEKTSNDANDDDKVYDVDAIINHKGGQKNRQYLVRWKGYGSDDDTWEKESSLDCVLCKYKKEKNLN